MQLSKNIFRQFAADALDTAKIVHRRRLYSIQSAKMGQQTSPPRRANASNIFQRRTPARFGATRPMSRNRKTVRFIADLLYQMEAGMIRGQL